MYPKHMMRQTVTIYGGGTTDDYGQTTGETSTDHKARVEFKTRTGSGGAQSDDDLTIVTVMRVWIGGVISVPNETRIDYDGTQYRVEASEGIPDGTGKVRMTKLECLEWHG